MIDTQLHILAMYITEYMYDHACLNSIAAYTTIKLVLTQLLSVKNQKYD